MSSAEQETQVWTPDFAREAEPNVGGKSLYGDAPAYRQAPQSQDSLPEVYQQGMPIDASHPGGGTVPGIHYVSESGEHRVQLYGELPQQSTAAASGVPDVALSVRVGNAALTYENSSADILPGESAFVHGTLQNMGHFFAHLTGSEVEKVGTVTPNPIDRQGPGYGQREWTADSAANIDNQPAGNNSAAAAAASAVANKAGQLAKDRARQLMGRANEVDKRRAMRLLAPVVGAWMLTGAFFTTFNTFTPGGLLGRVGVGDQIPVLTGSPKDLVTFAEAPIYGGKAVIHDVEGILGIAGGIL